MEERLASIDERIGQILEYTSQAADEFYRTVYLKRAFQVVEFPENALFPVGDLIRDALPDFAITLGLMAFLYVLTGLNAARVRGRAQARAAEESADQDGAAQQVNSNETRKDTVSV